MSTVKCVFVWITGPKVIVTMPLMVVLCQPPAGAVHPPGCHVCAQNCLHGCRSLSWVPLAPVGQHPCSAHCRHQLAELQGYTPVHCTPANTREHRPKHEFNADLTGAPGDRGSWVGKACTTYAWHCLRSNMSQEPRPGLRGSPSSRLANSIACACACACMSRQQDPAEVCHHLGVHCIPSSNGVDGSMRTSWVACPPLLHAHPLHGQLTQHSQGNAGSRCSICHAHPQHVLLLYTHCINIDGHMLLPTYRCRWHRVPDVANGCLN
jgi:hypothetical protein